MSKSGHPSDLKKKKKGLCMRTADAHVCNQGIFVHVAGSIVNSTRTFTHYFHGRLFRMLSAYKDFSLTAKFEISEAS